MCLGKNDVGLVTRDFNVARIGWYEGKVLLTVRNLTLVIRESLTRLRIA